jgi:hypothetical protein
MPLWEVGNGALLDMTKGRDLFHQKRECHHLEPGPSSEDYRFNGVFNILFSGTRGSATNVRALIASFF